MLVGIVDGLAYIDYWFGRKKDKSRNEWIIQYFVSLWSEIKVQKVVGQAHVSIVYKAWLLFLYIRND